MDNIETKGSMSGHPNGDDENYEIIGLK